MRRKSDSESDESWESAESQESAESDVTRTGGLDGSDRPDWAKKPEQEDQLAEISKSLADTSTRIDTARGELSKLVASLSFDIGEVR